MTKAQKDEYWMDYIQQCRVSGLSDYAWCSQNGISTSSFYYNIKHNSVPKILEKSEVAPIHCNELQETKIVLPKKHMHSIAIHLEYNGFVLAISNLMAIVRDTYELDPIINSLFLFCGKRCDRLKALHFDKDGFVLLYKPLDSGCFQWPCNSKEVRNFTRQEFRRLMKCLSIEQPKAIIPVAKKPF